MRSSLGQPVGTRPAPNRAVDQRVIMAMLSLIPPHLGGPSVPVVGTLRNGTISPQLQQAIYGFQRKYNPARFQDGRIDPGGRTLKQLNELLSQRVWRLRGFSIGAGPTTPFIPPLPTIDFGESVEMLEQPSTNACWATVATKIKRWTTSSHLFPPTYHSSDTRGKIEHTLAQFKRSAFYKKIFSDDTGLPRSEHTDLFITELRGTEMAIYKKAPTYFDAENLIRIVSTKFMWCPIIGAGNKPKVVNTIRQTSTGSNSHIIMLTGFSDRDTPNKYTHNESYLDLGGTVTYEDTRPGAVGRGTISISDLDYHLAYIADFNFETNSRSRCWIFNSGFN